MIVAERGFWAANKQWKRKGKYDKEHAAIALEAPWAWHGTGTAPTTAVEKVAMVFWRGDNH